MTGVRVILVTVAGPRGHVDVGVRSDATPGDLADALGSVIGVSPAAAVIEHRSPPRPGVPDGGRALVGSGTALAEAGVADGDLVLFRGADGGGGYSWPEVQQRPAEFGAGSPPPRAPALSSPPVSAPLAPVPAAAVATTPDLWDPAPTAPDVRTAGSAVAEPQELSATAPDVWSPAQDSDVWPAPGPAPEDWTEGESGSSDIQSPAAMTQAAMTQAAMTQAAMTQPDIGRPPTGNRFMTAPKLSQPGAGRHARSQAAADDMQLDEDQEAMPGWRDGAAGPSEQDRAWWRAGQEVNPDEQRG